MTWLARQDSVTWTVFFAEFHTAPAAARHTLTGTHTAAPAADNRAREEGGRPLDRPPSSPSRPRTPSVPPRRVHARPPRPPRKQATRVRVPAAPRHPRPPAPSAQAEPLPPLPPPPSPLATCSAPPPPTASHPATQPSPRPPGVHLPPRRAPRRCSALACRRAARSALSPRRWKGTPCCLSLPPLPRRPTRILTARRGPLRPTRACRNAPFGEEERHPPSSRTARPSPATRIAATPPPSPHPLSLPLASQPPLFTRSTPVRTPPTPCHLVHRPHSSPVPLPLRPTSVYLPRFPGCLGVVCRAPRMFFPRPYHSVTSTFPRLPSLVPSPEGLTRRSVSSRTPCTHAPPFRDSNDTLPRLAPRPRHISPHPTTSPAILPSPS